MKQILENGKKNMNGTDLTEDGMNGFPSKDISKEFDKDKYRLLVVANKFLTGFDQPKLTVMYVDKKLEGVESKLKDEDKADFKIKAKQFVKIYGQMASIMTFEKPEWEKLFWFLKFLIPKLIVSKKEHTRTELKLYKKIAEDEAFKHAMQNTVKRILSL